jgi:hypothetical protein
MSENNVTYTNFIDVLLTYTLISFQFCFMFNGARLLCKYNIIIIIS